MSAGHPVRKYVRVTIFSIMLAALLYSIAVTAGVVDFSPGLLRHVADKWGSVATERLSGWRATELDFQGRRQKLPHIDLANSDELLGFNGFWNRVPYYSDAEHWELPDYWATPVEMLASNGGDCEDYSIAKYFSLRELGVPAQNLRITYVRALKLNVAHMVLAYYPTPEADPYILDNLTDKMQRASERTDLEPVYSFNDEDLWAAGAASFKGKASQIRLWSELLDKMAKERRM